MLSLNKLAFSCIMFYIYKYKTPSLNAELVIFMDDCVNIFPLYFGCRQRSSKKYSNSFSDKQR